jgi:hypothetical protein
MTYDNNEVFEAREAPKMRNKGITSFWLNIYYYNHYFIIFLCRPPRKFVNQRLGLREYNISSIL